MSKNSREFRCYRSVQGHSMVGLTLIELLVTISVLAIGLSIGVPSMSSLINNSRAATATNDFIAHLNFARSEAIKRGTEVTLCKTADPSAASPVCSTTASWHTGWLIFVDGNTLGTLDGTGATADKLLRIRQATASNINISGTTSFANSITYRPNGRLKDTDKGTLTITVSGLERQLFLSNAGRVRVCNPAKQTCTSG